MLKEMLRQPLYNPLTYCHVSVFLIMSKEVGCLFLSSAEKNANYSLLSIVGQGNVTPAPNIMPQFLLGGWMPLPHLCPPCLL